MRQGAGKELRRKTSVKAESLTKTDILKLVRELEGYLRKLEM
jgi:hypothetical protein